MNSDQPNTLNLFFHNKAKERNEMSTIEKAMEKKEGEITASTILSQCERMNSEELNTGLSFMGGSKPYYVISVYTKGMEEAIYLEVVYTHIKSKPLTEILSDLIGIEYQYLENKSQGEMK